MMLKVKVAACVAVVVAVTVLLSLAAWDESPSKAGYTAAPQPTEAMLARPSEPVATLEPLAPMPAAATAAETFLTPDLRYRLESVLQEAGEAQIPHLLKQLVAGIVQVHFEPSERVRAMELLERYVDYRVAVGTLVPPVDLSDPQAVRTLLYARRRVRERYFDSDELRALFGAEEELDRFTLAKLEIARNTHLDAAQQSAAMRQAERILGEETRLVRSEAVRHLSVADQTARFDAQGVGQQERHEERRKHYGEDAASRLAQLDRDRRAWNARLDQYEAALRDRPDDATNMRARLFTPEELLRLEGALARRAQVTNTSNARAR
jgi:lipase chaperone LimK